MTVRKCLLVTALLVWCLICPLFSYLMAPRYLAFDRLEWTSRLEFDHEYFGAI